MKKQNLILSAALAAVFSSSVVFAEAEVTGKIVHESAKFTKEGTTIGAASANDKDVFKTETSARIYIDGEADQLQDGATYHVELNLMKDNKATTNYDSNESYTQRDALREAYVDSQVGDWSLRTGKQQVVWGTADGMKLLDMINPTDYGEMAQNQMEDSRIPVWMVNAETTNADGSEFQVVVSQPRENVFAGLNRNVSTGIRKNNQTTGADETHGLAVDQGHAFIMKGPDSITGKENGFLNIVPDIASIAAGFRGVFDYDMVNGSPAASNDGVNGALYGSTGNTVQAFATTNASDIQTYYLAYDAFAAMSGNDGSQVIDGFISGYGYDSNLNNSPDGDSSWATTKDSAFEYMGSTTFATFDAFVGAGSQYVYNMPSDSEVDLALRYKNTTKNGVNYSVNGSYNYDKNPIINLSWRNSSGELLKTKKVVADGQTSLRLLSLDETEQYGGYAGGTSAGAGILRFEQTVERSKNLGGSFDMAVETDSLGPIVIRGEGLYQKDVYQPVMDLDELSIGNLTESLKMEKTNRFKYVLGVDITALTNMMISAQIIQDRNTGHIDTGSKFTTDYATMHLTNGFNKAEKNKEFYSLFLSKPFGASGEHRWNNIFMFEENGGKWNRLDAEFSIDDDTQVTAEYNKYWGDANTQFGQLEKSSNVQVGFKYSF